MSDQKNTEPLVPPLSVRAERRVHAAFALACLALLALFLGFEWRARGAALEATQARSGQLAAAVLQQGVELMRQAELVTGLVRQAQDRSGSGDQTLGLLRDTLAAQAAAQPDLREVAVYAADGRLLAGSAAAGEETVSARGLAFFEAQRGAARDALLVGTPLRAPRQGEWLIPVSRRLQSGDGEFAGVVVALLRLRRLDARFAAWDAPPGTVLALHGRDGTLLARHPFVEQAVGMDREASVPGPDQRAGAFDAVSPLDGVERRYSWVRDDALPLLALAGVPTQAALAPWREQAGRDGALAGALLLLVALAGGYAARAVAAQRGAALALEQSLRYLAVRSDVTARRQAEIELRQALQHVAGLNQELARLAAFDEVTGLPNRRQFNGAIAAELRRAQRSGLPLAVLSVGVDHFDALLDGQGAAAGEDCLRRVAMAVRGAQRRPGDLSARWSGAEFAVLLPDTDAAGALAVAELIRRGVQALSIAHGASPRGHVTVSIGAYAVRPTVHDHPQTLLERAAQALWQAREEGCNQVQLHGPVVAGQETLAETAAVDA